MIDKPKTSGLRHVALFCLKLEECVSFYTNFLNMTIEWQPDKDNYYLTSGNDNLALHRAPDNFIADSFQYLDHIGFILDTPQLVDHWYEYFKAADIKIEITTQPRTHRDGARSFYCKDPDGRTIQMMYHPPISEIIKYNKQLLS
ncbi:MAG: VOC family protein [Gammaproteobacteria bacterium]|nr:VOC family protein [Gammaproteobacteria bacterium]